MIPELQTPPPYLRPYGQDGSRLVDDQLLGTGVLVEAVGLAVVVVLAGSGEVLAPGQRRQHDADGQAAGDDLAEVDLEREKHQAAESHDRPVGAVLQVGELLQLVGLHEVDRHRSNEHGTDGQADGDVQDVRGDGEGAGDPVEREGRVLQLQVEEHEERRRAGQSLDAVRLSRGFGRLALPLLLGLLLFVLVLEVAGDGRDRLVHQDGDGTGRPERTLVVVGADQDVHDERDDQAHVVQPTDLPEGALDGLEPDGLALGEEEVQTDLQQVQAGEHRDQRVGVLQVLAVLVRVVHGQLGDLEETEVRGELDDRDREVQPHADDGDQDAPGEEPVTPLVVELAQNTSVDDGVVEGQRGLQAGQHEGDDDGTDDSGKRPDLEGDDDADEGQTGQGHEKAAAIVVAQSLLGGERCGCHARSELLSRALR